VNWLEFFAALIDTVVSWPVVFLITVWTLRHQIGDLLRSLSEASFRYGELEGKIKLKEGLERAEQTVQQIELETSPEQEALPPIDEADESLQKDRDALYTRAEKFPQNAVYKAWLMVQFEAQAAAIRTGLKDRSTGAPFTSVVRMLADEGRVPSLLVSLADELARLHNETLSGQVPVTEEAAIRYIDLSLRLVSHLRRVERSD
jgi:hypothetical protein